jgi:hypothetical protein
MSREQIALPEGELVREHHTRCSRNGTSAQKTATSSHPIRYTGNRDNLQPEDRKQKATVRVPFPRGNETATVAFSCS